MTHLLGNHPSRGMGPVSVCSLKSKFESALCKIPGWARSKSKARQPPTFHLCGKTARLHKIWHGVWSACE